MFEEEENEMRYKILLPVSDVPNDTSVTKKTGEKEYKIQRKIRIFAKDEDRRQEIIAKDDTAFLVPLDGRGDVNVISGDTEVVVHMAAWEVMQLVDPEEDK